MRAARLLPLAIVLAAAAAPAVADVACEHVMTSKRVGTCLTVQYLLCENGERRQNWFYADNATGVLVTDADLNPMSFPPMGGDDDATESAVLTTHRAFSLDELLRTGRTSGRYDVPFFYETTMTGSVTLDAELTGQQVGTSGVTFQVARLRLTAEDPLPLFADLPPETEEYQVLIEPERRLMIDGPPVGPDQPVIDVILPGEPGFEEMSYDCPVE